MVIIFQKVPECSAQQRSIDMPQSFKRRVIEEATIYKGKRRELTDSEKKVTGAAVELCLSDVNLLNR